MVDSNQRSLGDKQLHNCPVVRIAHPVLVGLPGCIEQHNIHLEKGENPVTSLAVIPHLEMSVRQMLSFEAWEHVRMQWTLQIRWRNSAPGRVGTSIL